MKCKFSARTGERTGSTCMYTGRRAELENKKCTFSIVVVGRSFGRSVVDDSRKANNKAHSLSVVCSRTGHACVWVPVHFAHVCKSEQKTVLSDLFGLFGPSSLSVIPRSSSSSTINLKTITSIVSDAPLPLYAVAIVGPPPPANPSIRLWIFKQRNGIFATEHNWAHFETAKLYTIFEFHVVVHDTHAHDFRLFGNCV